MNNARQVDLEASELIDAAMDEADPGLALVRLLDERGDHYQGRTIADAEHLRGRLIGSLEQTGIPDKALPFVLEELASGRNSSNVAAAGRALRAAPDLQPQAGELVVAAIRRLRARRLLSKGARGVIGVGSAELGGAGSVVVAVVTGRDSRSG